MKTFKSGDLTNKRAEVFLEAEKNGVVIQVCNTNGDIRKELFLLPSDSEYVKTDLMLAFPLYDKV